MAYWRRTLTQLTRIEGRHRLAGTLRFGRKGKVYESYHEGQEDELNTLGLVLNMVVLWNTRYMNAALNYLRQTDFEVLEKDVERLSRPLLQSVGRATAPPTVIKAKSTRWDSSQSKRMRNPSLIKPPEELLNDEG